MTAWIHNRKGRIVGEAVREDDKWIWVRLIGDQELHYYSEANRGRIDRNGETICLRKAFMQEVDE